MNLLKTLTALLKIAAKQKNSVTRLCNSATHIGSLATKLLRLILKIRVLYAMFRYIAT